jgi:multisubunit Na+/H+ antiporter MnhG subunit
MTRRTRQPRPLHRKQHSLFARISEVITTPASTQMIGHAVYRARAPWRV